MTGSIGCPRCGAPSQAGARFCGSCGTPVLGPPPGPATEAPPPASGPPPEPPSWLTAPQVPVAPPPVAPPPAASVPPPSWNAPTAGWNVPPTAGPTPAVRDWATRHGVTAQRFTAGDWPGAVLAVLACVGSMLVLAALALAVMGVAGTPSITGGQFIALVAMVVALAMGGSVNVEGISGFGVNGAASVAEVPLALTVIGFGALAMVFVRRLRDRRVPNLTEAALQALRVWIVLLGALLVVCLVGRFQVDAYPTGGGFGTPGLHMTAGIGSTLFFGTCWLAFVLVAATIWRLPALLPPRLCVWRDRAGGPVAGAAVAIGLCCVAALLYGVLYLIVESAGSSGVSITPGAVAGVLVLLGPNVLLAVFGFAVGVPLTATPTLLSGLPGLGSGSSGGFGGTGGTASLSLLDVTDQEPIFWLVPLVAAVAIVVGGLVAALHGTSPAEARRSFWRVGVALGAFLLVIAVSTSASAGGGVGAVQGDYAVHLHFVIAPLFGLLWGLVGGWVGALLAPGMPAAFINGVRSHTDRARRLAYFGSAAAPGFPTGPYPAGPTPGEGRPS